MGNFSSATGAVTLVMMLLGRSIFKKFGWRVAALVTPTVSLIFCYYLSVELFPPYHQSIFHKNNISLSADDWCYR